MDILINGLALPKKGHCTIVAVFSDGSVDYRDREEMAFHRTKAVALPEHGRLGELDKIAKRFHSFYEKHLENGSYETAEIWKYAEQEVRLQGTIVEASNGTDN